MLRLAKRALKSLYVNMLPADVFDDGITIESAKFLFKKFVDLVELENHSYCNRTCWFCPNSFLDRRGPNLVMSDGLYSKVLDDLASIDYSGTLVWAGYHEP